MNEEEFLSLSYKQLEDKTGINRGTWSKYFSHESTKDPSWKSIEKICKSLSMDVDTLMCCIKFKRNIKKIRVANKQRKHALTQ